MPLLGCDKEWGCTLRRRLLHFRPMSQQQGYDLPMPLLGCDKEWGCTVRRRLIHICAFVHEQRHNLPMPLLGCDKERGEAARIRRVDVGLLLDKRVHLAQVPFERRLEQRVIHWPHGQKHRHESEHCDQHYPPSLCHVVLLGLLQIC